MANIQMVKPTREAALYIADHMRQADTDEVWAAARKSPREAMLDALYLPGRSVVVLVDSVPCAMLGVVTQSVLFGHGVVWMLGTDEAMKHRRLFLELSPPVIREMLDLYPYLFNYVHSENKQSIRWLSWLGFTIEPPAPYGVSGELFHKFHIEKKDHV